MLPKIKRLQRNVKKFQNNSSAKEIPEFTITSQGPRQANVFAKTNKGKINNGKQIPPSLRWNMTLWTI